jgi:hypothetical protein
LPSSCADCLKIWEPQPPGTRVTRWIIIKAGLSTKKQDSLKIGFLTYIYNAILDLNLTTLTFET